MCRDDTAKREGCPERLLPGFELGALRSIKLPFFAFFAFFAHGVSRKRLPLCANRPPAPRLRFCVLACDSVLSAGVRVIKIIDKASIRIIGGQRENGSSGRAGLRRGIRKSGPSRRHRLRRGPGGGAGLLQQGLHAGPERTPGGALGLGQGVEGLIAAQAGEVGVYLPVL